MLNAVQGWRYYSNASRGVIQEPVKRVHRPKFVGRLGLQMPY